MSNTFAWRTDSGTQRVYHDLSLNTLRTLRMLAKDVHIENYSTLRKAELIKKLEIRLPIPTVQESREDLNRLTHQNRLDFILMHRTLNPIKPGILTVSAYAHFYPVCYKDARGKLRGLDIDIINLFAQHCGLKVEYHENEKFDGIWLTPPNKISDIAIGGIGISKSRTRKATEWTIPYFYVMRTLVYNKHDPLKPKSFPEGVHRIVKGTVGSTGWRDAVEKLKRIRELDLLESGTTDKEDVRELEDGEIQGLLRGSFVGKALIRTHPELGMVHPWNMDPRLISSDGECFAYPCHKDSGIAVLLSAFLTGAIFNGDLKRLVDRYKLD